MADQSAEVCPTEVKSTKDESTGNWWDSWLTSAKSKSAEMYSMVKNDLEEIGSVVRSEASHVFTSTSTVIGKTLKLDEPESPANVMKKSFSTFIGQVSTVLNPEPDDEDDTEVILSSGDTTMLSTYKKELEALQRVDATFIVPAESSEFDAWRASLELADENRVISHASAARRLAASATLRAQYERLVPDAVSEEDFWERYLFRMALLQDRLAAASRKLPPTVPADPVLANLPLQCTPKTSPKKVSPIVEVESEAETPAPSETENPQTDNIVAVVWEDEDFAHDVELTEEQQILLLEEYEKEITSKKLTKQSPKDKSNNNSHTKKTGKKQTIDKLNNKPGKKNRSPKKSKDVCGNELVEDYFGENPVKDDASANSDESWEKEFEIDDVTEKA